MPEIDNIGQLIGIITEDVVRDLAQSVSGSRAELEQLLKANAPFDLDLPNRKRDQHLRNRIRVVARDVGTGQFASEGAEVRIEVFMPGYAQFTEFGTDPHEIRPRDAAILSFFVEAERVFADVVQHPGTEAQEWVAKSIEEWRDVLLEELDRTRINLPDETYTIRLNP